MAAASAAPQRLAAPACAPVVPHRVPTVGPPGGPGLPTPLPACICRCHRPAAPPPPPPHPTHPHPPTHPTPPQAYNQRATVLYLQQRYAAAVADCRVVLELNPYHFAAASGMGMCCSAIGDTPGAIAAFEHAVAVNPRMKHLRQHILQLRQLLQEEERAGE